MACNPMGPGARTLPLLPASRSVSAQPSSRPSPRRTRCCGSARSGIRHRPTVRSHPGHELARLTLAVSCVVLLAACGARGTQNELAVQGDGIVVLVEAMLDTVMASTSHVLAQERIALRRYEPETGYAESGFVDLARYPAFFDPELWDATERLVKLRFYAERQDSSTLFRCEPLYNPYEVITDEIDRARLIPVPQGHPGFEIATALTRRIAAHAEGRAVAAP